MLERIITIVVVIAVIRFAWPYIADFIGDFFDRFPKIRTFCIGLILLSFVVLISLFGATSVGSFIKLFLTNAFTVGIVVALFWFLTSDKTADLRRRLGKLALVVVIGGYLLYTVIANAITATSMSDFISSEIASLLTPVAIYYVFKFLGSDTFIILTTEHNCTNCIHYINGDCSLYKPDTFGGQCSDYKKKPY